MNPILRITIAGKDVSAFVLLGSLSITEEINATDTCSVDLYDKGNELHLVTGMPVVIEDVQPPPEGAENPVITGVFNGQIEKPGIELLPAGAGLMHHLSIVDWGCIMSRRFYSGTHLNYKAGDIVKCLIADGLTGEGFTVADVQDGPVLKKTQFAYLSVADCMAELSRLTGYKWWVDAGKGVHFVERIATAAPWGIVANSDLIAYDLQVEYDRSQYRNVQRVKGTKVTADKISQIRWTATAGQTVFYVQHATAVNGTTAYDEIEKAPEITVNDVVQLIGSVGDPNIRWVFEPGSNTIRYIGDTPLSAGDVVELSYFGRFPILGYAVNKDEITARQAIEGGTGIYEAVEVDEGIDRADIATAKAETILEQYDHIPTKVMFRTSTHGLHAGQLLDIALPELSIGKKFLIDNIRIKEEPTVDETYRLQYSVETVGSENPRWREYYRALLREREQASAADQLAPEFMPIVHVILDVVKISDTCSVNISDYAPAEVTISEVGFCEVD
ncbi:MAG: hypothetical protein VB144_11485 [Clostridia bacterium]|nr:hypothetical protein [Clostridia bacterium]